MAVVDIAPAILTPHPEGDVAAPECLGQAEFMSADADPSSSLHAPHMITGRIVESCDLFAKLAGAGLAAPGGNGEAKGMFAVAEQVRLASGCCAAGPAYATASPR